MCESSNGESGSIKQKKRSNGKETLAWCIGSGVANQKIGGAKR